MKDHLKIIVYSVVSIIIAFAIVLGVFLVSRTAYSAKRQSAKNATDIQQIVNFLNAQIKAAQEKQGTTPVK